MSRTRAGRVPYHLPYQSRDITMLLVIIQLNGRLSYTCNIFNFLFKINDSTYKIIICYSWESNPRPLSSAVRVIYLETDEVVHIILYVPTKILAALNVRLMNICEVPRSTGCILLMREL